MNYFWERTAPQLREKVQGSSDLTDTSPTEAEAGSDNFSQAKTAENSEHLALDSSNFER
jgi:hypothetical protein